MRGLRRETKRGPLQSGTTRGDCFFNASIGGDRSPPSKRKSYHKSLTLFRSSCRFASVALPRATARARRAFLHAGFNPLRIDANAAGVRRLPGASGPGAPGPKRHHTGLVHLEGGYAQLTFGIIHDHNHLIELHWDLHQFIDGILSSNGLSFGARST
jgi:hypothetical protein